MTTVYFIRHAEPNYANRDEFSRDLTPKGIKYYQADFGYQDFNANKHKFPWIMAFEFDGIMLKHYHEIHMDDTP